MIDKLTINNFNIPLKESFNDEGELENVASNEDFSDDYDSEGSFDEE